jgi:hypothetical protein
MWIREQHVYGYNRQLYVRDFYKISINCNGNINTKENIFLLFNYISQSGKVRVYLVRELL